jgi:hypothetical protein
MNDSLLLEEYKSKWAYVIHTETLQMKYIQWYFTVVAAVFIFIYSDKYPANLKNISDSWIPLTFLTIYSLFVKIRLLLQKRNYNTYTSRLQYIEVNYTERVIEDKPFKKKYLSVFKLQYYAVVLASMLVISVLIFEVSKGTCFSIVGGLLYGTFAILLSFTKLVGN